MDPVDGNDANDGSAWVADGSGAGPFLTIQSAIGAANSGDQVWLKKGTHFPAGVGTVGTLTNVGVVIDRNLELRGGFDGHEVAASERDPLVPRDTTIDGRQANAGQPARHVLAIASGVSALVEGVAVRGGRATSDPASTTADREGAGIYILGSGTRTVRDCWVFDNRAAANASLGGGGIIASGTVTIERCFVAANTAPSRFGGGIACRTGTYQIRDCVLSGNATGRGGGFATSSSNDSVQITRTVICGNSGTGSYGGGIYISGGTGNRYMSNLLVAGNSASTGSGVAITNDGIVGITNCTVADNVGDAGQVALTDFFGTVPPPLTCSVRNTVVSGGDSHGLYEASVDNDFAEISNCLFFGNATADVRNDGADVTGAAAVNSIADATVGGNVAGDPLFRHGASGTWETVAIAADGVFAELVDSDLPTPFVPGALVGRLIRPDSTQPYIYPIVANTENSVTVLAEPGLLALIAAGDTYQFRNYQTASGSPAIDAGADFLADSPETNVDIARIARPAGAGFDIGAYEAHEPIASTVTVTSDPNPSGLGATATLRATVSGDGPTGLVEFFDGASSLGSRPLVLGTATLDAPSLALGEHDLKAAYAGDDNYAAAESDVHVHSVILGDLLSLR